MYNGIMQAISVLYISQVKLMGNMQSCSERGLTDLIILRWQILCYMKKLESIT
jgi:hypothetical protein